MNGSDNDNSKIARKRVSWQQRKAHNRKVIKRVSEICDGERWHRPSYAKVVYMLTSEGILTSDNRPYTRRGLYRMLQRNRISGIWGISENQHKDILSG